ncbi:MAG: diguanylate cyclase [Anaeromyxobacteraceae bacterium]
MPASVLLVDDERFARTLYADYLRAAGYAVEVAEDAPAAVKLLEARRFDVLLTDIVMPGGDGLQLLADAKRLDPDVQVVVITALDRVDPAVRAMRAGASDYLVKPVTPEALQLSVQRSLSTRALLAENSALRGHVNLFETCQRITGTLERETVLHLALPALAAECGASAAALLEREGEDRWRLSGVHGLPTEDAGEVLAPALPRLSDLVPDATLLVELDWAGHPGTRCLCLPLSEGPEILGAACLLLDRPLDAERTGRAAFICRHLGMALRTLGRLSHVEQLAYVDDVTHLYNNRFLDVALDRELAGGRPFSLLFMDLDRFKMVNDRHGHLMGSALLGEFGRVLRSCVRDEDVLVRYGGDEFVALLAGVDSGGGLKVAERVRRAVEDHRFLSREGLSVRLTVSIGLASHPEHAPSKALLLELADRAMYRGKESTRNVVYIAAGEPPHAAR